MFLPLKDNSFKMKFDFKSENKRSNPLYDKLLFMISKDFNLGRARILLKKVKSLEKFMKLSIIKMIIRNDKEFSRFITSFSSDSHFNSNPSKISPYLPISFS